jgi:hypothetical protein
MQLIGPDGSTYHLGAETTLFTLQTFSVVSLSSVGDIVDAVCAYSYNPSAARIALPLCQGGDAAKRQRGFLAL